MALLQMPFLAAQQPRFNIAFQVFVFVLIQVIIIWRSYVSLSELHKNKSVDRIRIYVRALCIQSLIFAVSLIFSEPNTFSFNKLLKLRHSPELQFLAVSISICLILIFSLTFCKIKKVAEKGLTRSQVTTSPILPTNANECKLFALISIMAGISEEVLYRGWLFAVLFTLHINPLIACLTTALLFGLSHTYQGKSGVLKTAILGLFLAIFYLASGMLIVPIVIHALIDLIALAQQIYLITLLKKNEAKQSVGSY